MAAQQNSLSVEWEMDGIELHEPLGALLPENIVPVKGPFDLVVTFKGTNCGWDSVMDGRTYCVRFFLEGLGAEPEVDLGPITGPITTPEPEYVVTYHYNPAVDPALPAGLYQYSATVTFTNPSGAVFPGLAGYAKSDDMLQIYPT